ncbi:hypothetical protein HYDPIDRAFT_43648 [Hydnomerulius pinastri MD-312]|uniref:Anaphase-promoting complex subunit 4 WD40 domain-containing protein n=1 Tax=Hydnomerulius pinastri MD-312 TaxID=994086 RepID=A0A0C9W9H8_9AGAM|nr:hypothetical protein HYDPIDRAFT_43648 [Hydnomerulius pinastri MD-312]
MYGIHEPSTRATGSTTQAASLSSSRLSTRTPSLLFINCPFYPLFSFHLPMASSPAIIPETIVEPDVTITEPDDSETIAEPDPVKTFQGHPLRVTSVAFSPDNEWVVTGARQGDVRIWSLEDGTQIGEVLEGHSDLVREVAVSKDGKYIGSGADDNKVILRDVSTREIIYSFQEHSGWVMSVDFSHDSRFLASGSLDKTAYVWDVGTGECVVGPIECNGSVWCTRFSPDGSRFVTTGESVHIWHSDTGDLELEIKGLEETPVWSLAWTHDAQQIFAGSAGHITTYDASTGDQIRRWEAHDNRSVRSLSLSPTGTLLASSSDDHTAAYVWHVSTGRQVRKYKHDNDVPRVAYSPTGEYLATACEDKNAYLWESPPEPDPVNETGVEDFLDLPAVLSPEEIEEAERGPPDFRGSFPDFPATARPPGRGAPAASAGRGHRADGAPVSLKAFFKSMRTRPSRNVELEEVRVRQAGEADERERGGGKLRVAAARMKLFYASGARPYLDVPQIVTPVPPEFGGAPVPAPDTTNTASSSTGAGTTTHAQTAQLSHPTNKPNDAHGGRLGLCCF